MTVVVFDSILVALVWQDSPDSSCTLPGISCTFQESVFLSPRLVYFGGNGFLEIVRFLSSRGVVLSL